ELRRERVDELLQLGVAAEARVDRQVQREHGDDADRPAEQGAPAVGEGASEDRGGGHRAVSFSSFDPFDPYRASTDSSRSGASTARSTTRCAAIALTTGSISPSTVAVTCTR